APLAELGLDGVEGLEERLDLGGVEQPDVAEHGGVGAATGDVVGPEAEVEVDALVDGIEGGVLCGGEPSGPELHGGSLSLRLGGKRGRQPSASSSARSQSGCSKRVFRKSLICARLRP